MTTPDIINLSISIGLGIISLVLSVFAIWLSFKFNQGSTKALDTIRDLAGEVRVLVQANLHQQTDFSTKMLDSIIEQNRFGQIPESDELPRPEVLEDVIKQRMEVAEAKITLAVENTVQRLVKQQSQNPENLRIALESIRSDIQQLTKTASTISSEIQLPPSTQAVLKKLRKFPAHFVVLAGILRSGATSIDDLRKTAVEYSFPAGWEGGVQNLIQEGILRGEQEGFKVSESDQPALAAWMDRNWPAISKLITIYGERDKRLPGPPGKDEIEIAKDISF
ncbi:MAG: hypothetical protein M3Y84_00965 [Acidobacteriota bacterium]|nr:hypothetical protein [Acidobacteriota bacterium]